jgi:hypothetical protein
MCSVGRVDEYRPISGQFQCGKRCLGVGSWLLVVAPGRREVRRTDATAYRGLHQPTSGVGIWLADLRTTVNRANGGYWFVVISCW